jgi:hypothetical protein
MAQNDGFLGAQSVWIGIAVAAAMFFGWRAFGPQPERSEAPVALLNVGSGADARVDKLTRAQCLAMEDRVWAVMSDGVECLAYAASPDAQGAGTALVYLGGDVPEGQLAGATQETSRQSAQRRASAWAAEKGVPVVILGRPGLMGSSGFHLLGGRRDEGFVIDAGLDALKEKLGIRRLALAGQSGGSRIIAQLMVIGRRDISCAAMGAGAYDIPRLRGGGTSRTNVFGDPGKSFLVPMLKAGDIPAQSSRRSFVIGDPRDKVAPFEEQKAWADKLSSLGHHVQLIEAKATDPDFHGMSAKAVAAAALCMQDKPDPDIRRAVDTG